jgi:hypothetical protein
VTPDEPSAPAAGRLDLGAGDFEVAAPDLRVYEGGEA